MLLPGKQLLPAPPFTELPIDDLNVQQLNFKQVFKFTDYSSLSAPHILAVQAVLHGKLSRYKLPFEDAVLLFDHGCLMGRVFFAGRFYGLPPIELDAFGWPYLRTLSRVQRPALTDFCKLPKGILLFYFTLLKQALNEERLYSQWLDPKTGKLTPSAVPMPLRPWLEAVGWPYAFATEEAPGECRAS